MIALRHVIPEDVILAEAGKIGVALIVGGYDPQDLPLTMLAVEAKLRDLRHAALEHGIPILGHLWSFTDAGDVDVVFKFQHDTDAVGFRMMV